MAPGGGPTSIGPGSVSGGSIGAGSAARSSAGGRRCFDGFFSGGFALAEGAGSGSAVTFGATATGSVPPLQPVSQIS